MKSQPLLRLDKTPATQRPPSADNVDLLYDAESGALKAVDSVGDVPFAGASVTAASLVTAAEAMTSGQESDFKQAIGLEDENGNLPITGFTLTNHTDSTLAEGVYAEDFLKKLRRHDGATTGGLQVFPSRYSGFQEVDYDGEGGSGSGSIVLLETLQTIVSAAFSTGDSIRIFGTTSFQLDPSDLPNVTPVFQGYAFGDHDGAPTADFWDLSGSAAANVYQDVRHWSMRWTYNGTVWAPAAVNCMGVQHRTTAAGGTASTVTDGLTSAAGVDPQPIVVPTGSSYLLNVPLYWAMFDAGTPFTSGTARIAWDLTIDVQFAP